MHEYHVDLPKGVQLSVEIGDTPITLHLTFKDCERYTFIYEGDSTRKAWVKKTVGTRDLIPGTHERLPIGSGPDLIKTSPRSSDGASFAFIDPDGSQMP